MHTILNQVDLPNHNIGNKQHLNYSLKQRIVPFHKVRVNKMKKKIKITLSGKEIGLPEKIVFIKKGKDNYYAID